MSECIDKYCVRAGSADAGSCVHCRWQGMLDEVIELDDLRERAEAAEAECARMRYVLRDACAIINGDIGDSAQREWVLFEIHAILGDAQ